MDRLSTMKKLSLIVFILLGVLSTGPNVHAARILISDPDTDVSVGSTIPVTLQLDSEGESFNAVSGSLTYSSNLSVVGFREDDSIISLWVETPQEREENKVTFSGIITGGFSGTVSPFWDGMRPGALYTVLLQANEPGAAVVTLNNASVLRNNGEGTEVMLPLVTSRMNVISGGVPTSDVPADTSPPELFIPEISRDPSLFSNQYFVAFTAMDLETGIDHYEIARSLEYTENGAGLSFKTVQSPYLLQDQRQVHYLYVKAIDRAGNERVAVVHPVHSSFKYTYLFFGILGVILVLLALAGFLYGKKIH